MNNKCKYCNKEIEEVRGKNFKKEFCSSECKIQFNGFKVIKRFNEPFAVILDTDMKWILNGIKLFNENIDEPMEQTINIHPDYQRPLVWSLEQKQKYLAFYLKGGMYTEKGQPLIFNFNMNMHNNGKGLNRGDFELIDGQQRLNAIIEFMNGEFYTIIDGEEIWYKDVSYMPFNIKYKRLELSTVSDVINYYIDLNDAGEIHTVNDIIHAKNLLKKVEKDNED